MRSVLGRSLWILGAIRTGEEFTDGNESKWYIRGYEVVRIGVTLSIQRRPASKVRYSSMQSRAISEISVIILRDFG